MKKLRKVFTRIPHFIIDNILQSEDIWREHLEHFYNLLKNGFEKPEVRNQLIYFKFYECCDTKLYSLKMTNYVIHLMLWRPFIKFNVNLDKSYILDCSKMNTGAIKNYLDSKMIIPFRKEIPNKIMNEELACVIEELGRISNDFNPIMSITMNLKDTCDLMNRNQEYNDIIHSRLDENLQPYEVEQELTEKTKRLVHILSTEENNLKPILNSRQGIKDKQLCEYEISIGNKPDLEGNTFPRPINTNFLVYGLETAGNYLIDASGKYCSLLQ